MSAAHENDPAELSFSQAMEELEAVLRRIEGEEIDIDQLGTELGRAAELLELCRKKIRRAEMEVQQIVQKIEEEEPGSADAGPDPAASDDDATANPADREPTGKAASSGVLWSESDQDDDIPF